MKKELLTALLASALVSPLAIADAVKQGKELAWSRKKGNCLTFHMIEGGQQTGNSGPPLMSMKARYQTKPRFVSKSGTPPAGSDQYATVWA